MPVFTPIWDFLGAFQQYGIFGGQATQKIIEGTRVTAKIMENREMPSAQGENNFLWPPKTRFLDDLRGLFGKSFRKTKNLLLHF